MIRTSCFFHKILIPDLLTIISNFELSDSGMAAQSPDDASIFSSEILLSVRVSRKAEVITLSL